MSWHVLRLSIAVEFPSGAAPGAGRDGNAAFVSRDGSGAPLLRGSALAGVLRHEWVERFDRSKADADHWFGHATTESAGQPSRIGVHDLRIEQGSNATETRMHNAIDRHTGAPIYGGLFSIESIAPRASGALRLTVRAVDAELEDAKQLLSEIGGLLESGITVGGSASRGLGLLRQRTDGESRVRIFDLTKLDDHGAWLDERHSQNRSGAKPPTDGSAIKSVRPTNRTVLDVQLRLPRGQDMLIGGDSGLDASIEPQRIRGADGSTLLRFPGSAFRGVMRKWVARLAVREGHTVRDSHARAAARSRDDKVCGADLGWGYATADERARFRQDPSAVGCPVMSLFGSLYAKGRVHIADAIASDTSGLVQRRTHVSIDRFGGGASNGFLFNTDVTIGIGTPNRELSLRIELENPSSDEARWMAQTIKAIDLGVLRVGSSKASGRFEVASIKANGPHAELFANIGARGANSNG